MNKKFCDKCKREIEDNNEMGFKFYKTYKINYWKKDIWTNEKIIFDTDELCEECFYKLIDNINKEM